MSKVKSSIGRGIFLLFLLGIIVIPSAGWAAKGAKPREDRMSSAGHLASRARAAIHATQGFQHTITGAAAGGWDNEPDCEGEDDNPDGPAGGQAEVSIAVDSTGRHVVIGFNDTRGFALNPVSV